ncbi:MAG: hypothetical protein RR416_02575 [Clostridia bacterium]
MEKENISRFFRADKYQRGFYVEDKGRIVPLTPNANGECEYQGWKMSLQENSHDNKLEWKIAITPNSQVKLSRLGLRLGLDCYMEKFPEWNDKLFPTALRCEKNIFWGCFCSPNGAFVAVACKSGICSWKNEYNKLFGGDVGHRIWTASVEFVNSYRQPPRHSLSTLGENDQPFETTIFVEEKKSLQEVYDFVQEKTAIHVPQVRNFVLARNEFPVIDGKVVDIKLHDGRNILPLADSVETSIFKRKDWIYYLKCAAQSASICQQKLGTHTESWYGYFSRVAYAKILSTPDITVGLAQEFDAFFGKMTTRGLKIRLKKRALPHRLQNVSCMMSLLADFYELTKHTKYLDWASQLADWLQKLQSKDGSYRSHGTHYTCVIYPAKSMLELAIAEKSAGRLDKSASHFDSAKRAVDNLALLMDNIQTEGEMTFEDGMISCEALQLGFLALNIDDKDAKRKYIDCAEKLMKKHFCLEQNIIPDCRMRGCTLRFWEARYDINFNANMLNSPHGWTGWKVYATYYLYMLTGKAEYLTDTINTLGACIQLVDSKGTLNWSFVADACVQGKQMIPSEKRMGFIFQETTVGEEYLPMISNWYRQKKNKFVMEYIPNFSNKMSWKLNYGGSCDNDVHEIFKCLDETLIGKAFVHRLENGEWLCYNCRKEGNSFVVTDAKIDEFVVFSAVDVTLNLQGKGVAFKGCATPQRITL